MSGPLEAAGATAEPSEYAPLTMDRYITGLWTQRSPLRDADVPYLQAKYYSASRFDSIIDGLNREITSRLSLQRRCGTTVYNANIFPPISSFYPFKWVQDGVQIIDVLADTSSVIFDATAGRKIAIFQKSSGAGKTRFQSVGPELFFCDGVDSMKWLRSNKGWKANTEFDQGDYIIDTNGNVQSIQFESQQIATTGIQVIGKQIGGAGPIIYFTIVTLFVPVPDIPSDAVVTFQGQTAYPAIAGQTLTYQAIPEGWDLNLTGNQIAFYFGSANVAEVPETGTLTTMVNGSGTSGGFAPNWSNQLGAQTADGTVTWTCFGSPVQNWGIVAPTTAPTVNPGTDNRYWQPNASLGMYYSVLDGDGNIQTIIGQPAGNVTGNTLPLWNLSLGSYTYDGGYQWINNGPVLSWIAGGTVNYMSCVLDSNGNLQIAEVVVLPGKTGANQPVWNTNLGGITSDGDITWLNVGPGTQLATDVMQYAYSYHCIDGSVSTASPLATTSVGILGPPNSFEVVLTGFNSSDPQCDQIWIWRTAQGGSTLLLLDQIPNPKIGGSAVWTYNDILPDTALTAQIAAPIADANDPPPAGITAPAYHLQRIWVIVGNTVQYTGGPDTLVGNGNTTFPPLNFFQFPETITRLIPITLSNGGLLVIGTANLYVILGTGASGNPFYATTYLANVGFLSYDAMDMVGSTLYGMTNKRKVVSLDPSAGYTEVGFPIGDQFKNVTTGGISAPLYDPTKTYVAWNERDSGDSGIYVSDGAIGWFRYSPVASPETGYLWSPRAAISGGTSAVQNVEVATGNNLLLIGPNISGPILARDSSTFTDNGTPYLNCYVTIGNIVLCETGSVAEVAHVTLQSTRIGNRPRIGLLYGEIAASVGVPFEMYDYTCVDPPDLPESSSLYSDRYSMYDGTGVCPKCDHLQLMIVWPVQAVGDELLTHSIYGAKWAERKQQ